MPTFPKRESDVKTLADVMIAGYTANPTLFPHADVTGLTAACTEYNNRFLVLGCCEAAAQEATEAKDQALDELILFMQAELKKSELDTTDNPIALTWIGWGARADANAARKPAEPRSLDAIEQGAGVVELDWKAPLPQNGGAVRSYVVERREQSSTGAPGPWTEVGLCIKPQITLRDQPRFVQLEYRVLALNAAGTSVPSNGAAVVL